MKLHLAVLLLGVAVARPALGANYRQWVGVGGLDILRVGVAVNLNAPTDPAVTSRTNHDYSDGYHYLDSSGNIGEGAPGLPSRTSNFGFENDSQVDLARGTLSWHAVSPGTSEYFQRSSLGARVTGEIYYRIVREVPNRPVFGVEARVGYLDVNYSSFDSLTTTMRLLTDSYQLGGVVPQPAPYFGSATVQPGRQRIGDTPTRTVTTVNATTQGQRSFSAKGWLFRLGALWQPWHSPKHELELHAGLALIDLKGALQLNERWVSTGQPSFTSTAAGERRAWLAGPYAGGTGRMRLTEKWNVFAGADFLSAGTFAVRGGVARAKFDFSKSILVSAGLGYHF